jgi:hydantoinase/carbamoylase family amidase
VGGGISRLALSNEDLEARSWLANRIEEAGFLVRDDEVGNLGGVLLSNNPQAKTLLIGSHLDTVPNGGKYDGSIGILAGLEVMRRIKETGISLPFHLELINFTDEEGTWQSFFGSLGFTGALKDSHWNDAEQDNGAFRVALFRAGIRPQEVSLAKREPESLAAYLELHIEQSEELDKAKKQIGIVSQIVGRSVFNYSFIGEASHAATTSRERQRDALQGAAKFITEMHRMTREDYVGGVANCGNVAVQPGAYNVVPELAFLRVELRHFDEDVLSQMEARLVSIAQAIAEEYHLEVKAEPVLRRSVAMMDAKLRQTIEDVCSQQGRTQMPVISYAGHDAQILCQMLPCAMIFVPSVNGISHSPKEFTAWEDIEAGANVLLQTVLHLAQGI